LEVAAYGSGHIHDTYLARYEDSGRSLRYIIQRINSEIFRDPAAVIRNAQRVCAHLRAILAREGARDPERRCLSLVPTREGQSAWVDDGGNYWRCFPFQEHTLSIDVVEQEKHAYEAARTFALFAARLADLERANFAITIPHFHDLPHRYTSLEDAIRLDPKGRAAALNAEIDQAARGYELMLRRLRDSGAAELPIRIVHNDCKVNNVLLDATSGEGLCVIDLDTVMPGTVLFDFGELLRSAVCRMPEDATQTDAMSIDGNLLRGVAQGYLAGAASFLTEEEARALPVAGSVMAFENAIRFLTDYLLGDIYYRRRRNSENLDRFRVQFRLTELLDDQRETIQALLKDAK
jgi:aminoglycoside phosphotransferase (APT) family kinase protein